MFNHGSGNRSYRAGSSSSRRSDEARRQSRTSPNSACSHSSGASDIRSATRCVACCCRRCAALVCGHSASTACCTSIRRSRASSKTCIRSSATSRRSRSSSPMTSTRRSSASARRKPAPSPPATSSSRCVVRIVDPAPPPVHAAGRARAQRRALRQQGSRLRRGRPASARPRLPVDLVRIDSIYNPVRRANFTVAETRVGQRTDYDRLTLTVETNGTISPEEAVSYAAALAQTHFQYFADFGSHARRRRWPRNGGAGADGAQARAAAQARRSTTWSCPSAR
jgi:hypothetical protein